MRVNSLFSSPVFETDLDFDLEKLKKQIKEERKIDNGVKKSNVKGWHSKDISNNERFSDFIQKLKEVVQIEFETILNKDRELELDNCWINISGKGAYNLSHVHPMSVISGVLFVDTEPTARLVFENSQYYAQYYLNNCLTDEFNNQFGFLLDAPYTPVNGRIVMFPSFLQHSVEQNQKNKERISISFNFNIVTKS